ncbi:MAG: lipoyl(octanoyl) transferase LipB [Hyphomicrobiales bacterium]|nr:lipoyl(octanoyl) transferase LipB [Rickettsiales bacterium]MCP5361703.1 lipoyl(octanoyl) transferase LipB [Hyphomicrobiales bacterium]
MPLAFPEWKTSPAPVAYPEALAQMEQRVADIRAGNAPELVWLLEHPPLYTAGTSARPEDLLDQDRFPVYSTGRGGQYTYHGPGQRVVYLMLDLRARSPEGKPDLRRYVWLLEEWIIQTLAKLGVTGERREGRIGIWVCRENGEENKIAALGVRVRQGVAYHGIAINVNPDLSHFSGIVPCGIQQHGVTSLYKECGIREMQRVDSALKQTFQTLFL